MKAGHLAVRVRESKLPPLNLMDKNLLQICEVDPYYGNKRGTDLARVLTEVADLLYTPVTQDHFSLAV